MKPLLVLGKVFLIGCLWSLFFIEGIRVILLINWHFDIFWQPHWSYLWNLWHEGWVIDHPKEWAFILILLASVPMWLTGWIFLSVVNWGRLFEIAVIKPIREIKARFNDVSSPAHNNLALKRVVKKKSYKEIRPNIKGVSVADTFEAHPVSVAIKAEDNEKTNNTASSSSPSSQVKAARPVTVSQSSKTTEEKKPFTHSVFDFDDDDDDFELDFDYAVKSIQAKQNADNVKEDFEEESDFNEDDSFNKNKKKASTSEDSHKKGLAFEDFENDIRDDEFGDSIDEYEEDDKRTKNSSKKRSRRDDFDEDFEAERKRDVNRRSRGDKESNRRDREEGDDRGNKKDRNDRRQNNIEKRGEQQRRNDVGNPIVDTLRQKGYEIISGVTIKNTYIDYLAVDSNVIYLCLVDKEVGDWLADEERFNNEEPLWFSETSHRVSPVRMVDIARNMLAKKLRDCKITFDLRAFVIIQNGNIINAEDMFEVWRGIDVDVTRINRGSPREIPLFSKSVDEVENRIDSLRFESLKKLIRSIG